MKLKQYSAKLEATYKLLQHFICSKHFQQQKNPTIEIIINNI